MRQCIIYQCCASNFLRDPDTGGPICLCPIPPSEPSLLPQLLQLAWKQLSPPGFLLARTPPPHTCMLANTIRQRKTWNHGSMTLQAQLSLRICKKKKWKNSFPCIISSSHKTQITAVFLRGGVGQKPREDEEGRIKKKKKMCHPT